VTNKGIKAIVLDFLVSLAGAPASSDLIAETVGLRKPQVNQALAAFVADGNAGIVRVSNGVYAYTGPVAHASPATYTAPTRVDPPDGNRRQHLHRESPAEPFTVVGRNKAGELMVKDAHNVVYRLVEV
jgi:hypothetical protein